MSESAAPHLVDATMYWSPGAGGVRRWLEAKHDWFARHPSMRHTIATPAGPFAHALRVPGLPLPFSGGYRVARDRWSAARALEALRPDAIELGDPWTLADAALMVADRVDLPVSLFCHADVVDSARRTLGAQVARRVARRLVALGAAMDRVRAPSRWMAERLRSLGVPRVRVEPLGVDTACFRPRRRDPAWRAALGLASDARVVMYAGRFAPEKRLDLLARAVGRLGAPWVLIAIGAGPAPPIGERVRRMPVERLPARLAWHLSQADLFVHAGARETFGLSALEALACGVPVVGSAQGDIAELLDDSVGCKVESDHPDAWAQAIEATAARSRAVLGDLARLRALRSDWSHVMPSLVDDQYRLLAAHRRRPAGSAPQARDRLTQ